MPCSGRVPGHARPSCARLLLKLLRPGGVVVVDNVLWDGFVANDADQSPDTVALRAFNDAMLADPRVDVALLPVGDGLSMITLAR